MFVFEIAGAHLPNWVEVDSFNAEGPIHLVLVDLYGTAGTLDANGDSVQNDYDGWEMAIQLDNSAAD